MRDQRRQELREFALAVNMAVFNAKKIDSMLPDQDGRSASQELGPTDPDDERVPYAEGEDDDWLKDARSSWRPSV